MEAKVAKPIDWDEYFPLLNKVILALLVVGGLLIASGVDVFQMGGRLLGQSGSGDAVASVSAGELVADSGRASNNKSGGYWRMTILASAGLLGVVVLVLYVMSVGGRDADRMKEQLAAKKKESQPSTVNDSGEKSQADTECNLSSYKLFHPPATEAAPALESSTA